VEKPTHEENVELEMRWGKIFEAPPEKQLLYWVLAHILRPSPGRQIDYILNKILVADGGFGGDPGWEMENIPPQAGQARYRVWADPEVHGLEPPEAIYDAEAVREALAESLHALAEQWPEHSNEVNRVLGEHGIGGSLGVEVNRTGYSTSHSTSPGSQKLPKN
jgi:hypothetical protein